MTEEEIIPTDLGMEGHIPLALRENPEKLQDACQKIYTIFWKKYKKQLFLLTIRAFKKWAMEFPLIIKCEEVRHQLRERTLLLETVRNSYLKDVVSVKYYLDQLDKINWDTLTNSQWQENFYDLHTIPSADIRNLVDRAKRIPGLSSNQIRENLIECGLLDPETYKSLNPWEHSRSYRRLCRLEKGSSYNYPQLEGESLAVSAPTDFKVYIRHCNDCIGMISLVKNWNTTIEEAIRFKVEYNAVDAKIEDFKRLISSLQDIIIQKEKEIQQLNQQLIVYEETNHWFNKWTKIKSLPQMIDEYEETIKALQNSLLMAGQDKESTRFHLSRLYDEKLSFHIHRQQALQDQLDAQRNSMLQDIALREKLSKQLQVLILENHELTLSNQDLIRRQSESDGKMQDLQNQIDFLANENQQFQQLLSEKDEYIAFLKQQQASKIEELQMTIDGQEQQLERLQDDNVFLRKENRDKQNLLAKNVKQIEHLEQRIADLERELYRFRFARKRTFKTYAIAVRCIVRLFRYLRNGEYRELGAIGYRLIAKQTNERLSILNREFRDLQMKYDALTESNTILIQEKEQLTAHVIELEELLRQRQFEYDDLLERFKESQDSIQQLKFLLDNCQQQLKTLRDELEQERLYLSNKFAGDFQSLLTRIKIFGYLQRNLGKQFYSSFITCKGMIEIMDLPLEIKHLYRDIALMNDQEEFGIVAPVMDEVLIEKAKINKPRKANIAGRSFGGPGGELSRGSVSDSTTAGGVGGGVSESAVMDLAEGGGHLAEMRNSVSAQQQRKKVSRTTSIGEPKSPHNTRTSMASSTSSATKKTRRQSDGSFHHHLPFRVSALEQPQKQYKKDYAGIFRNFGNRFISTLKYLKSEYPFRLTMDTEITFWMRWIRFGSTPHDRFKSTMSLIQLKKVMMEEAAEKERIRLAEEEEQRKLAEEEGGKGILLKSIESKNDAPPAIIPPTQTVTSGTATPVTANPTSSVIDPAAKQLEDLKSSLSNQTLESLQSSIPEIMIQSFFQTDQQKIQHYTHLLLQDITCLQSLVYHMKLHIAYYKKNMIIFKDLEIEYNDLYKRYKKMENSMEQNTAIKTKRQQMMKARASNAHLLNKDMNSYLQNVMKAIDSVKEQFGPSVLSVDGGGGSSGNASVGTREGPVRGTAREDGVSTSPQSTLAMRSLGEGATPAKQFMSARMTALNPSENSPPSPKAKYFSASEDETAITTIQEHHEDEDEIGNEIPKRKREKEKKKLDKETLSEGRRSTEKKRRTVKKKQAPPTTTTVQEEEKPPISKPPSVSTQFESVMETEPDEEKEEDELLDQSIEEKESTHEEGPLSDQHVAPQARPRENATIGMNLSRRNSEQRFKKKVSIVEPPSPLQTSIHADETDNLEEEQKKTDSSAPLSFHEAMGIDKSNSSEVEEPTKWAQASSSASSQQSLKQERRKIAETSAEKSYEELLPEEAIPPKSMKLLLNREDSENDEVQEQRRKPERPSLRKGFSLNNVMLDSTSHDTPSSSFNTTMQRSIHSRLSRKTGDFLVNEEDEFDENDDYEEFEEDDDYEEDEEEENEEEPEEENENFMNELELAQKEALAFIQRENELQTEITSLQTEKQELSTTIDELTTKIHSYRQTQELLHEEIDDLKHDLHILTLDYDKLHHENSLLREIVQNEYKYHHEKVNQLFAFLNQQEEEKKIQRRKNKRNKGTQLACSVCAIREYYDEQYAQENPHYQFHLNPIDDHETVAEIQEAMTKVFEGEGEGGVKILIPRHFKQNDEEAAKKDQRIMTLKQLQTGELPKKEKKFEELAKYEFLEDTQPFVEKVLEIVQKPRPATARTMATATMTTQTEEQHQQPVILSTDQPIRQTPRRPMSASITNNNKGIIYFRETNPNLKNNKSLKSSVTTAEEHVRGKSPVTNLDMTKDVIAHVDDIDLPVRMNVLNFPPDSTEEPVLQYERSKNLLKYARTLMNHTPTGLGGGTMTAPVHQNAPLTKQHSANILELSLTSNSHQPIIQSNASPSLSMNSPSPFFFDPQIPNTTTMNTNQLPTTQSKQRPTSATVPSNVKDKDNQRSGPKLSASQDDPSNLYETSKFRKLKNIPPNPKASPLLINNPMIFNQTMLYQPDQKEDQEDFDHYQQRPLYQDPKDPKTIANTAAFLQERQLFDRVLANEYLQQLKEEENRAVYSSSTSNRRTLSTNNLPTANDASLANNLKASQSERLIPSFNNPMMKAMNITNNANRPPSASRPPSGKRKTVAAVLSHAGTTNSNNLMKQSFGFAIDADSINDLSLPENEDSQSYY